ncbi:MAG: carbon-nitrogen hydrolase family protein [Planctomycetes bacterium]|nr:carbon-nitrogen hydrolase family protein [Planctomycetota bacterium]
MNADPLTLGMAQMLVEGAKPSKNLARAAGMIALAASQGCAAVVLPECLDIGWTHPAARDLAQPIPGPFSDILAAAAAKHAVLVAAGLTERDGDRTLNSAVLFSPEGRILLKHSKINILSIAQDLYSVGRSLAVADTPFGTAALTICADNFPSSLALAHSLCRMGARFILSPCSWAVDGDHDNEREPYGAMWLQAYSAIARLYDVTIVGVSNVGRVSAGPWEGRKCIGSSIAVGPGGVLIRKCSYGVNAEELQIIPVAVPPAPAVGTDIAPFLKDRGYDGP